MLQTSLVDAEEENKAEPTKTYDRTQNTQDKSGESDLNQTQRQSDMTDPPQAITSRPDLNGYRYLHASGHSSSSSLSTSYRTQNYCRLPSNTSYKRETWLLGVKTRTGTSNGTQRTPHTDRFRHFQRYTGFRSPSVAFYSTDTLLAGGRKHRLTYQSVVRRRPFARRRCYHERPVSKLTSYYQRPSGHWSGSSVALPSMTRLPQYWTCLGAHCVSPPIHPAELSVKLASPPMIRPAYEFKQIAPETIKSRTRSTERGRVAG